MAHSPKTYHDLHFSRALRLFFFLFIAIGAILCGVVFSIYTYETKGGVNDLLVREKYGVELRRTVVKDSLDSVASDLEFLAALKGVREYAETGNSDVLGHLEYDFMQLVKAKGVYDQARFLDASGMELVRINHNGGLPVSVSKNQLQNKGKRYYFMDTMLLGKGEVFVSPLDLNIEMGKVEVPHKPTIRFGTPVYGEDGKPKGAIVLNYLADNLLGLLRRTGRATAGQTMLLNNKGYWLLSPDSGEQWGFMFPDKRQVSFANRYPKLWVDMRAADSGQVITGNKIFTFTTVYPLTTKFHSSTGSLSAYERSTGAILPDQYFWKLVSYVPNSEQQGYTSDVLLKIFGIGALIFIVAGSIAWGLCMLVMRERLSSARGVEASNRDELTGLPNRRLFFDRLAQTYEHAQRYEHDFGLLYIDVDEFKQFNDAKGVDAGDELLVEVASRLALNCRKSDTVARIGGDEFAVILTQIHDRSSCDAVVEKVVNAMSEPFIIDAAPHEITVAIGVSMFPADTEEREQLLTLADKAMHQAKFAGKGETRYASE